MATLLIPPTPITQDDYAAPGIESHWAYWLLTLFPDRFSSPFASYHQEFWEWVWALRSGNRPDPFIAIWPRGFGKSVSIEAAIAALAARRIKKYVLYVSGTQDQADAHVASISTMLESRELELYYPEVANRALTKYNRVRAWRRNRLQTASGMTVDALGLNTAVRGAKIDDQRPDLIIVDDIDDVEDSDLVVEQKIRALTSSILPSGSRDLAIAGLQNLIHPRSIFSRLARSTHGYEKYVPSSTPVADFLTNRVVSGPHPALNGITYHTNPETGRSLILTGTPTWEAMGIDECQGIVDDTSLTSFLRECQHDVEMHPDGLFARTTFRHISQEDMAKTSLIKTEVWVDPAVTAHDDSDSCGISIMSLGAKQDPATGILPLYVQWVWEERTDPLEAIKLACLKAIEYKATVIGIETDQGGETWRSVYREAWESLISDSSVPQITRNTMRPVFSGKKAGAGHGSKVHRATQLLTDYEKGAIIHVLGPHHVLERALRRFPKKKPWDLVDSLYWGWHALRGQYRPARRSSQLRIIYSRAG